MKCLDKKKIYLREKLKINTSAGKQKRSNTTKIYNILKQNNISNNTSKRPKKSDNVLKFFKEKNEVFCFKVYFGKRAK